MRISIHTVKLLLTLLAPAVLVACSGSDAGETDGQTIRLTTSSLEVNGGAATRSVSQGLLARQFDSGDQIDIFIRDAMDREPGKPEQTYAQPLVYTADGSGNLSNPSPRYLPPYNRSVYVWGVYPKGAAGADVRAGNIPFSVRQDQSTNSAYKASDLMTGAATDNPWAHSDELSGNTIPLRFTHLLSKVNVNLTKTASTTDITEEMMKSARVYIMSTKPTTKFTPTSTNIRPGDATGTPFADGIYVCQGTKGSCIVVPQAMTPGDAFIKVVVGNDTFVYKVAAGGFSFEPRMLHTLNVLIHKANIILTTTIDEWTDGDSLSDTAVTVGDDY